MKLWNLSSFEDLNPPVVSTTDKESKASIELPRSFRKKTTLTATATLGAVMMVAAIATTVTHVNVSGSDSELRVTASEAASNIVIDRPPLQLLFGGRHHLKWDEAKEKSMLERAVAALQSGGDDDNRINFIAAISTEDLPADREHALNLEELGIKLR